jgi:hypothetical protein
MRPWRTHIRHQGLYRFQKIFSFSVHSLEHSSMQGDGMKLGMSSTCPIPSRMAAPPSSGLGSLWPRQHLHPLISFMEATPSSDLVHGGSSLLWPRQLIPPLTSFLSWQTSSESLQSTRRRWIPVSWWAQVVSMAGARQEKPGRGASASASSIAVSRTYLGTLDPRWHTCIRRRERVRHVDGGGGTRSDSIPNSSSLVQGMSVLNSHRHALFLSLEKLAGMNSSRIVVDCI